MPTQESSKRLAKNTLVLYFRTAITMLIALYTSRVVLDALGVDDFGVYNVVGGFVGMFSIISGSLSATISRFITFELGRTNKDRISQVFSTSINIQILLSIIIILLGETIGVWFLETQLNIPPGRTDAAFWVLQCSIAAFVISLLSTPYNSAIIAYEKMSAFAFFSITETCLKLAIAYLLYTSPIDRLVFYAVLLVAIAAIIRLLQGFYCSYHFKETKYRFLLDKSLFREMMNFAGWSFLSNGAFILNTQGVTLLLNIFFNVGVNAARGIASQVEMALMKFASDFSTALNPQITKAYAEGNTTHLFSLISRGAKFTTFLILLFAIPVIFETEYILTLWLGNYPTHTNTFVRLGIIATIAEKIGNTGYTACMATGTIRQYTIWITTAGCLVFPLCYLIFLLGAPAEACYIVFFLVYCLVDFVRLSLMKHLLDFPIKMFVTNVLHPTILVTLLSCIAPLLICYMMDSSLLRFVVCTIVSLATTTIFIYAFGLTMSEREMAQQQIRKLIHKL